MAKDPPIPSSNLCKWCHQPSPLPYHPECLAAKKATAARNAPAFPKAGEMTSDYGEIGGHAGLTKREYMATQIMAGLAYFTAARMSEATALLSEPLAPVEEIRAGLEQAHTDAAHLAVKFADALLEALSPATSHQPPATSSERSEP